jgi:hypothetical protein
MKTSLLAVALYLALPSQAAAEPSLQGLSGKIGVNVATWRKGDTPSMVDYTLASGLIAGASLHMRLWEPVSPQVDLLYVSRGSGLEIDGTSQGVFDLQYMDLLLLARAERPMDPVILFAVAGPQTSILLDATFTGRDGVSGDRTGFRRIDVGVVAGVGVAIGPFSWGTLTLEVRHGLGFIHVNPTLEDASLTNRTILFTLGYEYRRARNQTRASW